MTPQVPRNTAPHPRDHIVRFYEDDSFLCSAVGRFLLEGYWQGTSAVVIATSSHRLGIESALEADGIAVSEAKRQGRLVVMDAAETLLKFTLGGLDRGVLDPGAFRSTVGSLLERVSAASPASHVRVYGEMVDLLLRRGNHSAMGHLEELWNELRMSHSFQVYCGHRLRHLDRAEDRTSFETICRLHSHVLPAESYDEQMSTEERRRQVAELQQRARALETEVVERRRLDRVLRQERKRLRESNRRKDEFLVRLGHVLRNPLNPILTALDLMDIKSDEHSRRERDIIRRQAMHLAGLIEDLLDIPRITEGKVALRQEPMEISAVIARAIGMASPLLEQRAHLLRLTIPQRGLLVDADPVRLPQVFANLLLNAAKYTKRGGRIEVSARRHGDEVLVSCRDNGIGIAPELLATVFEPFVQGTRSLDRAEGGSGLGLALARSLVRLHEGTVTARSAGPGMGSTFTVRLPALRASTRPRTEPAPVPSSVEQPAPAVPTERVLIVDDNADCAQGFAEIIRLLGYQVEVALEGPLALAIAARFKPTIALIDIGLPLMDGYELARRLREGSASAPMKLIAVTGYGDEARAMSLKAGFDLHTVKPVHLESLRSLLAQSHAGAS